MAKKNFKTDLGNALESAATEATDQVVVSKRKPIKARKNFTSDLDSLFSETVEVEKKTSRARKGKKAGKQDVVLSGLDALIRRTTDEKDLRPLRSALKRVTFTMDKSKLEKLKQIARSENTYLKDIINEVISEYLQERKED